MLTHAPVPNSSRLRSRRSQLADYQVESVAVDRMMEPVESEGVLESHSVLLGRLLSGLFPWRGLTLQAFMDLCSREMEEINRTREAEGTRGVKGIYPLLFSTAFGYRCAAGRCRILPMTAG